MRPSGWRPERAGGFFHVCHPMSGEEPVPSPTAVPTQPPSRGMVGARGPRSRASRESRDQPATRSAANPASCPGKFTLGITPCTVRITPSRRRAPRHPAAGRPPEARAMDRASRAMACGAGPNLGVTELRRSARRYPQPSMSGGILFLSRTQGRADGALRAPSWFSASSVLNPFPFRPRPAERGGGNLYSVRAHAP